MRVDEHIGILRHDGEALADVAQRAGLDAPVPTCPGWQIRDLLQHLGGVHRWATAHVATRREHPFTDDEEQRFFAAVADSALVDWFRAGHRTLVDTLAEADPALTCWTFLPAPSPLAFWARRQAHETAIHRADAESALATVPRWDPRFAVDGVDELLNCFFVRKPARINADPPVCITLSATDAPAAWTIWVGPDGYRTGAGDQEATLALTGLAADLYLLLWNRADTDRLSTRGDLQALDTWRSKARVTWA